MMMPDDELAVMLRQAKDKRSQVGVLADLNLCSPHEMALHLQDMGLFIGTDLRPEQFSNLFKPIESAERAKKRLRKHRKPKFDEQHARALFDAGESDASIASALNVSARSVLDWRLKNNLQRPRGGKRERKQYKEDHAVKKESSEPVELDGAEEWAETEATPQAYHVTPEDLPHPEVVATYRVAPPEEEPELMTVQAFLATLNALLTPVATQGRLWINGSPVHDVVALHLRSDGKIIDVEIETEA